MDKVIRDGKVAVLLAGGWESEWFTANQHCPQCLFDPEIVAWVGAGKTAILPDLKSKYQVDHFYSVCAEDLKIMWIPVGSRFQIKNDPRRGETLELESTISWITA